ncbi:MAG: hypothetical protein IH845_05765 [Nanoarchaeota archaeon]|nr:hypothetical protein [Nanoarchaeota archaeon]
MEKSLGRIFDEVLFAFVKAKLITTDDREELNNRLNEKLNAKANNKQS